MELDLDAMETCCKFLFVGGAQISTIKTNMS